MGGSVSRQALDNHKKHLSQLCGPSAIHIGDPFWSQLAQSPLHLSALDPREVQRVMEPYCQQLGKMSCRGIEVGHAGVLSGQQPQDSEPPNTYRENRRRRGSIPGSRAATNGGKWHLFFEIYVEESPGEAPWT